ncbi:homeobox protein NANOG isoform X1 [Cricetulus griseus]|uniref:homeobox protein NANOG isoform X1 n=1 Tax=Cricetulus griseus TaxID=10029 RepID=UPI0007DA989A|nr:homeobox protein NANOG isoform X1 [Cricetulus griseus]
MSVDLPGPHSLPCYGEAEAPNFGDSSPLPEVHGPEENYSCLQVSATELLREETASPCPSSVDLSLQDSPDSSTSSKVKLPGPESAEGTEKKGEDKAHVKRQKIRTVFSDTQLCALRDRFQRQKYLSLQQMQELSAILNLSYKQVKTWFQNQRMKCKRWQKNQWTKTNINQLFQKDSAFVEYSSFHSGYLQGFLNTSESLPMWGSQTWTNTWSNQTWTNTTWSKQAWSNETWTNPAWSNQAWTNPTWSNQAWTNQSWCSQACNSQAWNTPFLGEDSLQPYMQCQQNLLASDVEASLEAAGEGHTYFSTPQGLELFLNYSVNTPGE